MWYVRDAKTNRRKSVSQVNQFCVVPHLLTQIGVPVWCVRDANFTDANLCLKLARSAWRPIDTRTSVTQFGACATPGLRKQFGAPS